VIFLRNVWRAKVRSVMTVLGVAVGVALFVAITAITTDLRQQISGAAQTYDLEIVVSERRAPSPITSRITVAQMAQLREAFGDGIAPLLVGSMNESWNPYALVIGAEPAFIARIPLTAGSPLADAPDSVLLGEIAAQRLGLLPGQHLTLGGVPYRVSGIFRSGSRTFDGGVMGRLPDVQALFTQPGVEPYYSMGVMSSRPGQPSAQLIAAVHERFPMLRAIPGSEFAGALRMVRVVEAFVTTISVIALACTALVVANTLVMAVAERTREIGILMAVGWTPWLVLRMLLAESLLLCLLGAVAGNALGLGVLHLVNGLDSVGFGWIPVHVPVAVVGHSVLLTGLVALLALGWPALVLARMQPLAALRHE
jgi:putative ABC transport system permease protein